MKCPNCGNEITGKFCTSCGTPAPTEEPAKEVNPVETQPANDIAADNAQPDSFAAQNYNSEPAANNFGSQSYNSEPVQTNNYSSQSYNSEPSQTNNFGSQSYNTEPTQNVYGSQNYNSNPQPFDYSAQTNQPSGMPVNNGYTGQQFTNVPNNNMPNQPKKGMSGGKIAIIVVSIVVGILLILGIIIGVVACSAIKTVKDGINDGINDLVDQYSSIDNDTSKYIDDTSKYISDLYSNIQNSSDDKLLDSTSHFYYREINDGKEIEITDFDNAGFFGYNSTDKNLEIKVPSTINGKPVTSIYEFYIVNWTDYDDDELNYKLIIPGSVKNIEGYALWSLDGVTEIVFEDGVEHIGDKAVFDCEELKKVTIPESVTEIEDMGVGYGDFDYKEDVPANDLTIVAKKGSVAEKYAQDNGFKVENN